MVFVYSTDVPFIYFSISLMDNQQSYGFALSAQDKSKSNEFYMADNIIVLLV